MKKINNKGFILAETLVVCVFLMLMFTMIYTNYFPIIGEYEKREVYDDVDGKYVAYWVKKLVESDQYRLEFNNSVADESLIQSSIRRVNSMNTNGYMRFECKDVLNTEGQRDICKNLLNSLEVANCDQDGNSCEIYITHYQIGAPSGTNIIPNFKKTVMDNNVRRYQEFCNPGENDYNCKNDFFKSCCVRKGLGTCHDVDAESIQSTYVDPTEQVFASEDRDEIARYCKDLTNSRVFSTQMKDYILSLPNYTYQHASTDSNFRVIVMVHHTKDFNDYYSFSTMEVSK